MGYEKSAHLYDMFDTKDNIDFFLHYGLKAGEILDIGAGTGRIAIPLAEKGVKVTCVEPSPAMRRVFKARLGRHPELSKNITLIEGDAQSFNIEHPFPAAFLSGCFDHFLSDRQRESALRNVHRHLIMEGIMVFDVFLGRTEESGLHPASSVVDGSIEYRRYVATSRASPETMTVTLVFGKYDNGTLADRIEEESRVGVVDRDRIHRLLSGAGYGIRREFGDYDFREYRKGDDSLIVEAAKKQEQARF